MRAKFAAIPVAVAMAVAGVAHAQDDNQEQDQPTKAQQSQAQQGGIPAAADWNYDRIYRTAGVRAENLLGSQVTGIDGEEIGELENAIFNGDGEMVGIVAEVGGFWDIGDRHIAVAFERVDFIDSGVSIPVSEGNVDEFELFGQDFVSAAAFEPAEGPVGGNWRLTDLVDDYAVLNNGERFGYVDDVLISRDGEIQAVVVESAEAFGGETYAYPFDGYGYGWQPGAIGWEIPYDEQQATGIEPFNTDQFDSIIGS